MGVAEELEELRKQGVTTKNAQDLKDAEGLSTPELSENAIKAEKERTRLANYGKEASEYLKTSPSRKKQARTNPVDDYVVEVKSPDTETATKQQAKDITNLIQITNDFSWLGDQPENVIANEEDEGTINETDCFLGKVPQFCPVDSMESATTSVRGALDEHILPTLNGARASIKTALDQHVVPNVDKVRQQSIETVDDFHKRSLETIDRARQQSVRTLVEVQSTSKRGLEAFRQQSKDILENSKKTIDGVSANANGFLNETVKPGVSTLTAIPAPWCAGTAPGWKGLSVWYCVLFEATLRAFGRVVFCDNPVTGIFIWFGILCASPLAATCSLLGALTVNIIAMYLDIDREAIRGGMYARNAVLIGTALVDSFGFKFPPVGNLQSEVPIFLFWSIALAPSTLLLECIWMKKLPNSPPSLLLPFNIVLLGSLLCASVWNLAMDTQIIFQSPLDRIYTNSNDVKFNIYEGVLNGLSRIFFADGSSGWTSGWLILVGVLFCDLTVAAGLLTGSFVATVLLGSLVFGENHCYLDSGYAGANPALCVAGIFVYLGSSWRISGLMLFGIVVSFVVQGAVDVILGILGAPVATSLGFCLTLFPLLYFLENGENSFIRTLPQSEITGNGYGEEDENDVEKAKTEETPLLA